MQHDNAAQRVTLQKAPAKFSFCLQNIDLSKALPISIQCWQFISTNHPPSPPAGRLLVLSEAGADLVFAR
jgi:hypothetical protein